MNRNIENFVHLHFFGKTTSPWSIGRMYGEAPIICCQRFLWGRAVRGPVLNYLLRVYCPHFPDMPPCEECPEQFNCPFYNLYGSEGEGDLKDTPKLVVTSLAFEGSFKGMEFDRIPLISRNSITNGVALGPIFVEHIKSGVNFEFEIILTGEAVNFKDKLIEAIRATLSLTGWGARCSRGYGRGKIIDIKEHKFDEWIKKYIDERFENLAGIEVVSLEVFPLLILDRAEGGFYTSILEKGFIEKLRNCMQERYWQFFKKQHYLNIEGVSGSCKYVKLRAWSRKEKKDKWFSGLRGSIQVKFSSKLSEEDLRVIGAAQYGIGKYKNQGLGALILPIKEIREKGE